MVLYNIQLYLRSINHGTSETIFDVVHENTLFTYSNTFSYNNKSDQFEFPPQSNQKYGVTQYEKNLAFHSLLR